MRRNQNFGRESDLRLEYFRFFKFFFAFPFSPFLFFLLQWLTFYWACFQFKTKASRVVAGNFALSFSLNFLSIIVHISGSIGPITLIWVSLERSFPPAEVEHRWWQFWSKVMTSEVEERPRFVTAGYGRHRSKWVKNTPGWEEMTPNNV